MSFHEIITLELFNGFFFRGMVRISFSESLSTKHILLTIFDSIIPVIRNNVLVSLFDSYDFVVCPIVHPRFRRELIDGKAKSRPGPLTRPDLLLTGKGKLPIHDMDKEIETLNSD